MDRLTQPERWEAALIAFKEGRFGSLDQANDWLSSVERLALRLHRLYIKACNEPLTARDTQMTALYERGLRDLFKDHGLGLYLNGDPRGNPVGILTPKTGKCNTMGGAEDGWRL